MVEALVVALDRNAPAVRQRSKKDPAEYLNVPAAFDIESSSTLLEDRSKFAFMYIWQFCLCGHLFYGRTWEDFLLFVELLKDTYSLNSQRRMIVYVHNLSFEFQFIRKLFQWQSVFALETRKVCKALTVDGIEFRCSYILSGYSLAKIGDNLLKYPVKKMVGDLDYSMIRTPETPLTIREFGYCMNDVLVVASYIQEKIEEEGKITNIPLTKTGYVRRFCREKCLPQRRGASFYEYRFLMSALTISSDCYLQLKRAYCGGFTHANAHAVGKLYHDVGSWDFTSSYPAVMLSEKYPMSKPTLQHIDSVDEFYYFLRNKCCMFDIELFGVTSCKWQENPLSFSKCTDVKNYVLNNGRIVSCDHAITTLTEVDFDILMEYYTVERYVVRNLRTFEKQYLPKSFVEAILYLYETKTKLKDVPGMEAEYQQTKENLNSAYGMSVTDICRPEILYNEGAWTESVPDVDDAVFKYNENYNRFLFYPWGIWITAYARKNLFRGISSIGDDYLYSDTDSIKATNWRKHLTFIDHYNEEVTRKISECLEFHGIDPERSRPKNSKGVEKPLGVWEFEGVLDNFKTLGAKRYMTSSEGHTRLTVAGLNKHRVMPYLERRASIEGVSVFDLFDNELYIPAEHSGKNTHTYIDQTITAEVTDYLDHKMTITARSSVHLSEAEYSLNMAVQFIDYLRSITDDVAPAS